MKLINQLFLLVFCAFVFSMQINAQTSPVSIKSADPRVAKALNQTKTEYQVSSKDGGYTVTFGTKGKRTQKVYIVSETDNINGVEMRLIFSFATIADNLPSPQVANLLLQQNMETIGVWAVQKIADGRYAIVNKLYIPANFDGEKLEKALSAVVLLADELEEQLTKKDEN
ncbi:MAG TPA: hypothetical protein VK308_13490 [Pyrinomonadaceae bacterium]|nr:hypothetical protein [Pyrinomonadaceae bacterium]